MFLNFLVSTPPGLSSLPTPASSTSSVLNEDLQFAPKASNVIFQPVSTLPTKSLSPETFCCQPTPQPDKAVSAGPCASVDQSFEGGRPTITDTSLNDVESEPESEIMECQIKIRSDIFEDEDDDD